VLAIAWLSPALDRTVTGLTFIPLGFLMLAAVFLLVVRRVYVERPAGAVTAMPAAARG
jgi:hypothetical protein